MSEWECKACGYLFNPEFGDAIADISPGISFVELPDDWTCPECGAGRDMFEPVE